MDKKDSDSSRGISITDSHVEAKGDIVGGDKVKVQGDVVIGNKTTNFFFQPSFWVVLLIGLVVVFVLFIYSPLSPTVFHITPTLTPAPTQTPVPLTACGGVSASTADPSGPQNFNRDFGFTVYNTGNSPLVNDVVRFILPDETGVWIGYGASNTGKSGITHISNPDQDGNRVWEYCADAHGAPIGHLVN